MSSEKLSRWLPAILLMIAIYTFSSIPTDSLPNFNFWDRLVKKGGHVLGYSSLTISYWYAIQSAKRRHFIAWLLALMYAISDEYHQSFVPGRQASAWDVLIFDNLGAIIGILISNQYSKRKK